MWNHRNMVLAIGAISVFLISQPTLVLSQEKDGSERIYAGEDLENARKSLADHKFEDDDIRRGIYDRDTKIMVLKLKRSGAKIWEIMIYRGTREQKGRVTLIKTLKDAKDHDFRGLIKCLGL